MAAGWRWRAESAARPEAGGLVAGRYRLLDPLGSGGMSTVWRAYDVPGRRMLAVKVLVEQHPTALLRLVQEQSLRLDHPHVVTAVEWAADDGAVALAMPLLRGGSVAELAARHGPLPAPLVAVLLDQLLAALEAVHRAGIVHRDVKPANLLLAASGRGYPCLRLADFGVALHAHRPRLTGSSGVVGTDGYMPAEQARGGDPEPWWDVHAAGVVARELLSGPGPGAPDGRRAELLDVVASLVDGRYAATEARRLLAEVGVPDAARWPALGMPPVPDVVGPDPRVPPWSRDGWAPAAAVALALALSATSLAVALLR